MPRKMEEIIKCLKTTEELKGALLDQQKLLKQLLIVFKNPQKFRCCPMCEIIFENNEYDTFEEHVMSHFEVDNDDPNEVSDPNSDEDEETTLSLEVNDVLCQ